MLFGGILGIAVSLLLPHQYDASVFLSTTIDYNRTGSLDELQEDRILGIPEDMINSDPVLTTACGNEKECDPSIFREHIRISRTLDRWRMTYHDTDAKTAVRFALSWQAAAFEALQQAKNAAIRAEAYQNELNGMTRCLTDSAKNVPSVCALSPAESSAEIERLSALISDLQKASHGLSSAILIGGLDQEQIELTCGTLPAVGGAAVGIFLGLLAALILSLLKDHSEEKSVKDE